MGRAHRRPHRDADAQAAKSAAEGEQLRNTVAALRAENQLLRERLSSVAHTAESEHNQHSHWRVRTGMEATVPFYEVEDASQKLPLELSRTASCCDLPEGQVVGNMTRAH